MRRRFKTVIKKMFSRQGAEACCDAGLLEDKTPDSEHSKRAFSAGTHFEALEPRLLLSATGETAAIGAAVPTPQSLSPVDLKADPLEFAGQDQTHSNDLLHDTETREPTWSTEPKPSVNLSGNDQHPGQNTPTANSANAVSADFETDPAAISTLETVDILANADAQPLDEIDTRQELVVVDGGIKNYEQLVNDILWDRDDGRQFEVVVLDPEQDGVAQISDLLAERQNIDALHLVTHGMDRGVKLGDTWIYPENLADHAGGIATWQASLAEKADLLFYGCNFAATGEGQALLDAFGELTGADVAASVDDSGHALLGGDWDLEYITGEIETTVAFSSDVQAGWTGLLSETVHESHETGNSEEEIKSDQSWGQTFQDDDDSGQYTVNQISIWLRKSNDAGAQTITVSLRSNSFGGVIEGSDTVSDTDLTTTFKRYDFKFAGVSLDYGSKYWVRVDSSGLGKVYVQYDSSGGYSGGDLINKDGVPESKDLTFRIVEDPNNPPVANDDSDTTAEDTVLSVAANGVLTNDTDDDGDTLSVSEVNGSAADVDNQITLASGALLTLNADGSYIYDPNDQFENLDVGQTDTDSFNYTISDGQGGTDTATVTVTIDGAEDAPVLGGVITGTVAEDGTQTASGALTITDADDNDNPISFANQGATNGDNNYGSFVLAGGTWTYTLDNAAFQNLDNGQSVTDTITYTATDGTTQQTITVTIDGAEDAPVAVDDANTTSEDTPVSSVLTLQSNDTDIDGDALSVDVSSVGTFATTQGGTIVVAADGNYTYTPAASFNGIDTFDYTVTDGTLTDTGTLTISVGATNDDPVATDDTGAVDEDATLTVAAINGVIQTNDTDPDGDTLTVGAIRTGTEAGSGTAGTLGSALTGTYGTLTLNADGSYTYIADQAAADALAIGVTATDTFTYTASDGKGGTDTAEIVITVTGTNDGPVAAVATAGTNADTILNGNVPAATDVDGTIDPNGYALNTDVAEGTLTFNADGSYSFDSGSDFDDLATGATRNVTFTYTATDNDGGVSAPATVSITVTGTNDLPVTTDTTPPPPIDDTDPDPITPPEPEPEPEPAPEEPPPTEDEEDASPDADDLIEEESDDNVTEIQATAAGTVSTQQRLVSNSLREFVQRTIQSLSLALDTDVELEGVRTEWTDTQPEWSIVPPRAASMSLGTSLTELGVQTIRALDFLENSLDGLKQEAENEIAFNQVVASSAIAVTTGLSMGYVAWLLRSGVLLSSLLSSMPAWRFLDPLPVLAGKLELSEEEDEESLETIIEQPGSTSADDPEKDAAESLDEKES